MTRGRNPRRMVGPEEHQPEEKRVDAGEAADRPGPAHSPAIVARLELRLNDLIDQHEFDQRRIGAQAAERRRLTGQAAELQRQADELQGRVDEMEAQAAEMERQAADLRRESGELQRRVTELEAELETTRGQLAALGEVVATANEEKAALIDARRDLSDRVQTLERRLTASRQERDEALAGLGASNRRLDEIDVLRTQLAEDLGQQRAQTEELRQQMSGLEVELGAVRTHAEELRGTIGELRERADAAEQSLTGSVEERRLLVAHLARAQSEALDREERLDNLVASRWYQLASATWRLRRRPLLLVVGLCPIALLIAAFAALALVGAPWPAFVGLGVVTVLAAGLIARRALRGLRRRPRRRRRSAAVALADGQEIAPLPREHAALVAAYPEPTSEARQTGAGGASADRAAERSAPAMQADAASASSYPVAIDHEREQFLIGAREVTPRGLRVAGVLDEMSRACLRPECDLFCEFTMADWEEKLSARSPHLLLVESAWSGNSGGWQYGVASYPHPDYAGLASLRALLRWCRERAIPTVFWNKEDPVHFDRFKEAAVLFDHILTTDSNRIDAYKALDGEHVQTISAMPFAAQPRLHNPIAVVDQRRLEPVFAGTYYRNRHLDRRQSLEMILDAARPFGLIIYDRTYGTDSDEFGFPERFRPHISGRLPYDQMIDAYKGHRVFVNVNSVVDSPTMFSRRVFELLACGTAVISTESVGIEEMFGDLVPVVRTPAEATAAIEKLLYDDEHFADVTRRARRLVLGQHTYRQRLAQVAQTAGFDVKADAGQEVTAIVLCDSHETLTPTAEAILAQNARPEEVIIGTSAPDQIGRAVERLAERWGAERIRVCVQDAEQPVEGRYRELGRLAATPWVAPMGDGAMYTPDHLRDIAACTDFADAQAIGTAPLRGATPAAVHRYVDALQPLTALVAREVVATHGWANEPEAVSRLFDRGVRLYAGDGSALTRADTPRAATGNGSSRPHTPRL